VPAGRLWVDTGRIKAWIFRPAAANRRVKAAPTNPVAPVIAMVSIMALFRLLFGNIYPGPVEQNMLTSFIIH
jgi:hypothetical protein